MKRRNVEMSKRRDADRRAVPQRTFCVLAGGKYWSTQRSAAAGFTLIELLVVIAIIAIIAALAIPAVGPMMRSSQLAEAAATLNGLMASAQTAAEANLSPVAIRIERAYETKTDAVLGDTASPPPKYFQMDKTLGSPKQAKWRPYQQARLVLFATPRKNAASSAEAIAFRQIVGSKLTQFPENAWLAPANCLDTDFGNLDDDSLEHKPRLESSPTAVNTNAVPFSRLDNFYIVFGAQGGVKLMTASNPNNAQDHYWYMDETQPFWDTSLDPDQVSFPLVDHPDDSARGVLIYDRKEFEQLGSDPTARYNFLSSRSRSIFINRSLGSGVDGRQQ